MQKTNLVKFESQRGAVLLVGLIMLFVLTLIGTSGITSVTLEERMVSNMQNDNKAFQGAEAALAECEDIVRQNSYDILGASPAIVSVGAYAASVNWWDDEIFWSDKTASTVANIAANADGLAALPTCVTEEIGNANASVGSGDQYAGAGSSINDKYVYRITAFSYGANTRSQAVVESIYAK